jgi:LPXTG-site transpeptidase (sortase) family protein
MMNKLLYFIAFIVNIFAFLFPFNINISTSFDENSDDKIGLEIFYNNFEKIFNSEYLLRVNNNPEEQVLEVNPAEQTVGAADTTNQPSFNENVRVAKYSDLRNQLQIPSLGVTTPIVFPPTASNEDVTEYLKSGVALYPGTARIGQQGNAFIFGHSSNYSWIKSDYNRIFATLPNVQVGSEIIAIQNGVEYKYRIFDKFEVMPDETWVLGSNPGNWSQRKNLLTLMTCTPVGSNARRLIIWAELVS